MSIVKRILLFFLLPIVAVLAWPPELLVGGGGVVAFVVIFLLLLGILLLRGSSQALTFSIFLQGMNVIVRLMLFVSHAVPQPEQLDAPFAFASLAGLILSLYLLLRMDRSDVRVFMTR